MGYIGLKSSTIGVIKMTVAEIALEFNDLDTARTFIDELSTELNVRADVHARKTKKNAWTEVTFVSDVDTIKKVIQRYTTDAVEREHLYDQIITQQFLRMVNVKSNFYKLMTDVVTRLVNHNLVDSRDAVATMHVLHVALDEDDELAEKVARIFD